MVTSGAPPDSEPQGDGLSRVGREAGMTVVWLRGDHDLSTTDTLSKTLMRAVAIDDGDLIVDLSEVDFMDASTINVLVKMRALLRHQLQFLFLRFPSAMARRVLDLCGIRYVPGSHADRGDLDELSASPNALGTWVAVPVAERAIPPATADEAHELPAPRPRATLGYAPRSRA